MCILSYEISYEMSRVSYEISYEMSRVSYEISYEKCLVYPMKYLVYPYEISCVSCIL